MQDVSSAFLAAMEDMPFVVRLTLDGTDVINEEAVQEVSSLGGSSSDEGGITLGGTVAGSVKIILDKSLIGCAVNGRELFLEIGLEIDSTMEWLPMGTYTVTDALEDDGVITVTASDALSSKFDVEYEPIDGFDFDAEDGVDAVAFLKALCTRRGVEVDASSLESIPLKISPDGYTERQIIGFIAALYGGFADIDRNGILKIRWYAAVDRTGSADDYYDSGMEKASYDFTVGWLKCYVEPMAETLAAGDTAADQGIYFECPWMDEDRLEQIWQKVRGFTYRPVTGVKFFGDPRLDPGDIITLEDLSGATHAVPAMAITHEWDGGIITEISADGQAKTDAYEGPVQRETKRLYSRIVKKQNEIELSIRDFDGEKIISLINLSETEALIQAPKIKLEGLVTANSNFKILEDGSVKATNAVISGKITATSGTIGGCEIVSGKLQVPAANITGTLTASQLNADGMTAKNVSITGEITAESGTIGGWTIKSGKIICGDGTNIKTAAIQAPTADTVWVFAAGGSSHDSYADCPFRVNKAGELYATKATISGVLAAGQGSSLAGFEVDENSFFSGTWNPSNKETPTVFMCTGTARQYTVAGQTLTGWAIGAGGNFGVTTDGGVYAVKGNIGGFTLDSGYMKSTANGYGLGLHPAGITLNSKTFFVVIYSNGGATPVGGLTASGWVTL